MAFTYTPGNAAKQGDPNAMPPTDELPSGLTFPTAMTWDGQQLVIADDTGDELWTLARNGDGSYTPGNASLQGDLPSGVSSPFAMTWDGQQLVIADTADDELWTLARNGDGTYTPGNASLQGDLPSGVSSPFAMTWDGQQLVIADNAGDELWTLARNGDGTYTPGNAALSGDLPSGLSSPQGITWDGQQIVIVDFTGDELWTLARNGDGTYTPGNAALQGVLDSGITDPRGMTWDGQQLVIADTTGDELWTLAPDNERPVSEAGPAQTVNPFVAVTLDGTGSSDPDAGDTLTYAWTQTSGATVTLANPTTATPTFDAPPASTNQDLIFQLTVSDSLLTHTDSVTITVRAFEVTAAAAPTIIDSNGTTTLTGTVNYPNSGLTYRWASSIAGVFTARTALATDWTSPVTVVLAAIADLTLTVRFGGAVLDTVVVQVVVRELTATPLTAATVANQPGATGDVVDFTIGVAVGGRSPYSYAYADLPEELGAIGRRIRGRLITPGTSTVTVTVTDANGDTDTETFTWTVTGAAILPPSGINVRMDWGRSFFSLDESDVTARITSGISASRGRTTNSAILGRTAAGQLTFQLNNSDGLYDLENTSSSLHGLILPGILVQFRDGGEPLWTGVLDTIPTTYDDRSGQHRAHVTAWGVYSTLREATVSEGSLEPASTIQAFCDLLETIDACGVPDPAATYFQMGRWWEIGRIRDAIRHIEDTEGGFAFEDRQGNIGLQASGHRAARTLSATFTALPVALAGEIKVVGRPQREIAVKDVHNQVVGFIRQYETLTAETVFERQDPISIDRGGAVTLFADFEEGTVVSLDLPASGTDYVANEAMDGSGTDRSSLLTVAATISQFNEIEVAILYPVTPGAPAELFLTNINIKGSILRRLQPAKVPRRTQASIDKYKLKTLELRDTWIQSQANMEARADAILALLDSPEIRVEFDWIVEDYADFTALEISDRIRLKLPSYTDDAYIENLALRIPLSGKLPICTVQATVVR